MLVKNKLTLLFNARKRHIVIFLIKYFYIKEYNKTNNINVFLKIIGMKNINFVYFKQNLLCKSMHTFVEIIISYYF